MITVWDTHHFDGRRLHMFRQAQRAGKSGDKKLFWLAKDVCDLCARRHFVNFRYIPGWIRLEAEFKRCKCDGQ